MKQQACQYLLEVLHTIWQAIGQMAKDSAIEMCRTCGMRSPQTKALLWVGSCFRWRLNTLFSACFQGRVLRQAAQQGKQRCLTVGPLYDLSFRSLGKSILLHDIVIRTAKEGGPRMWAQVGHWRSFLLASPLSALF